MTNYKLVIQGLMTHFFPPNLLKHQNIYLNQDLFKPIGWNISNFIFRINNIVNDLKHSTPFGINQALPEDEIINLFKLALTHEWHKHPLIQ